MSDKMVSIACGLLALTAGEALFFRGGSLAMRAVGLVAAAVGGGSLLFGQDGDEDGCVCGFCQDPEDGDDCCPWCSLYGECDGDEEEPGDDAPEGEGMEDVFGPMDDWDPDYEPEAPEDYDMTVIEDYGIGEGESFDAP